MSKQLPGCSGLLTPCLCKGHEANLSSCCIKTPPHPSRGRGTLTLHLLRRVVQKHLVHTVRCFASLHRIVPARHTAGRIRRARIPQNEPYASKYVTNICSGVRCLHPKEGLGPRRSAKQESDDNGGDGCGCTTASEASFVESTLECTVSQCTKVRKHHVVRWCGTFCGRVGFAIFK
jgi:hypothetical protein